VRFASTLKGVGLAYYKDLQEDKEPLFDSVEQMELVLEAMGSVIATLTIKKERISADLDPFMFATDLADYLVRKKLPFRRAHQIVGRIVGHCIEKEISLDSVSVATLKKFSELFNEDVRRLFSWKASVKNRSVKGGTGRARVEEQIRMAEGILKKGKIK
jgi:argininosuccinate lyase